ncbi:MAG TPA: hypothetical protein VF950_05660 [Planctomycetota bacterium]
MIVPLFVVGLVCAALAFFGELGSSWVSLAKTADAGLASLGDAPPGVGIPYLALLDGLILYTFGLMGLSMLLPSGIHAKLQGIVTLIVSLLLLLGSIALIILTFILLIVMVTLLMAPIFGTIAYLALYGDFETGRAAGLLSAFMLLKLAAAVCLILAHPRFLQNKGLVLLVLTSLLAQVITSFLHGFPPGVLVSITDAIAGLITAILAAIWSVFLLVGSVIAVVKAVRVDRGTT